MWSVWYSSVKLNLRVSFVKDEDKVVDKLKEGKLDLDPNQMIDKGEEEKKPDEKQDVDKGDEGGREEEKQKEQLKGKNKGGVEVSNNNLKASEEGKGVHSSISEISGDKSPDPV